MIRVAKYLAPELLSIPEAVSCARRGLTERTAIRKFIRRRRLRTLGKICNGRQAAWALAVLPWMLRRLIANGLIGARKVQASASTWRWEIETIELEILADELQGRPPVFTAAAR